MDYAGLESNFFKSLLGLSKKSKLEGLTSEDIKKAADSNISYMKDFIDCYEKFQANDMTLFVNKFTQQTAKDEYKLIDTYNKLTKAYTGKAKQLEDANKLSPIYHANKKMMSVVKEIRDNVNELFEDKFVSVNNCRISAALALGILRQSDALTDYSVALWTEMVNLVTDVPAKPLPYKVKFLNDNTEAVATIVNDICARENTYAFAKAINDLKRKNNDVLLQSNGVTFEKYVPVNRLMGVSIGLGAIGLLTLMMGFLRISSSIFDKLQYRKYQKRKDIKEALIGYAALLKYDLEGMDPSSPEYQRIRKVIAAYEEKIAKLERQIKEYEED